MPSYLLTTLLLLLPVYSRTEAAELSYGYDCPADPSGNQDVSLNPKQIKVAFLVQNAGNIPDQDFQLVVYILTRLNKYYIDQYNASNYIKGLCLFSGKTEWSMPMDYEHHHDQSNLSSYVNLDDKSNDTRFDFGFNAVEDEFNSISNTSANAPNVCILLTTSPPDNMASARAAAENLKTFGVNVLVITVGDGVVKEDIEALATNPSLVLPTGRLSQTDLRVIADNITSRFTKVWAHAQVLPKYTKCYEATISILIIVDVSEKHSQTLRQLEQFVNEFNLVYTTVTILMINSPTDDDNFLKQIPWFQLRFNDIKFEILDSTYNLQISMRRAQHLLNEKIDQNEKIVIIATDKKVDNINDVVDESQACQESGIHIMVLGVGSEVSEDQLSQIITDPTGITTVSSVKDFTVGLKELYRNLCPARCPKGWIYHDGMCFLYQWKVETWHASYKLCRELRGKLVSITTPQKYAWLKLEFLDKYNESTHIGLQKYRYLTSAVYGRMFRWDNGKPLVFSDWNQQPTPPEPNGAFHERCVVWYPDGWRDDICSKTARYICEMEAHNTTKQVQRSVKLLPLWDEKVCQVPMSGFDEEEGPVLVTGSQCRPLFSLLRNQHKLKDIFNCSNSEMISQFFVCDGVHHCQDGSDENNCSEDCTEHQFHCTNGRCVSSAYFCDFWDDCGDNSDEDNCVIPPCETQDSWQCKSGQCIPAKARCDLYFDCYDWSDEYYCYDTCKHDLCNDGTCIPSHWVMDGEVDCGGGNFEDEVSTSGKTWKMPCYRGRYRHIPYLFTNSRYSKERPNCTMVFDGFGKHFESFTTQNDDCSDDNILCPIGFYRCPASYCIPIERVCDDVMDCINGEEEVDCDNYECPGYYRCSDKGNSYCLHPSRVCNGDVDCPGGKDEVMCDVKCPESCSCFGGVVECKETVFNESSPFDPKTRKILVADSQLLHPDSIFEQLHFVTEITLNTVNLSFLKGIFDDQENLIKLNISQNILFTISPSALSSQRNLQILDLSYNPLINISSNSFTGLRNLQELYMKSTSIEILEQGLFSALVNLKVLDITGKSIHAIVDQAFSGLSHLNVLYMQGNIIMSFSQRVFDGLETLKEFHTDVYSLCCSQVRPASVTESKCVSPKSSISSCKDLLASDILRSSIWLLCIASLFGNVMSTLMRFLWERNSMKNGFGVFVIHLGIADFLMGIYLLIIAVFDMMYKGTYIWNEFAWRRSAFCQLAGALSALSSEASTFFICLITLDRFLMLQFPFGQFKFRQKSASIAAVFAWILAFIIAVVPLSPTLSHWNFYNKNGACLALPFSAKRTPGWTYSVTIFTGLNLVAFIIIALGQLSIYRSMKQASMITSKERRAQEAAVARGLLLIVATDFLCWFPVGIMSVLALNGVSLDGSVYAWTAVFILPVNSALNPFLYTIPAMMQKMRRRKKKTVSRLETELSEVQPRVKVRDPEPCQVLLEDVLQQLKHKQEKIQLMKDIWGGVIDCLVTNASQQPQPNAIYLGMRGKVVHSVSLSRTKNSSSGDLITATMALVNSQPHVEEKTHL